jgi:hypothetical protein
MAAKRRIARRYSPTSSPHSRPALSPEAVLVSRHRDTRCQPLHVPFRRVLEGSRRSRSGRRAAAAPARRRRRSFPTARRRKVGLGRTGQVRGHDVRRAPIEGKRRSRHPAVVDRHELRQSLYGLLFQKRDGIGPVRPPYSAAAARAVGADARRPGLRLVVAMAARQLSPIQAGTATTPSPATGRVRRTRCQSSVPRDDGSPDAA